MLTIRYKDGGAVDYGFLEGTDWSITSKSDYVRTFDEIVFNASLTIVGDFAGAEYDFPRDRPIFLVDFELTDTHKGLRISGLDATWPDLFEDDDHEIFRETAQRVYGSPVADNIHTSTKDDEAFGLGGGDRIFGNEGNDKINGGDGSDTLVGGIGNDKLTGGSDADFFTFEHNGDNANLGKDTIIDFVKGEDFIDFSGFLDGEKHTRFIGHGEFSGRGHELRYEYGRDHAGHLTTTVELNLDVQHHDKPELFVVLRGQVAVEASDFLL